MMNQRTGQIRHRAALAIGSHASSLVLALLLLANCHQPLGFHYTASTGTVGLGRSCTHVARLALTLRGLLTGYC